MLPQAVSDARRSRALLVLLGALASACATEPKPEMSPTPVDGRSDGTPVPAEILARSRAALVEDAAAVIGDIVLDEMMAAPTAILARGVTSFPRMIHQPDGSLKREPPSVAAAVLTGSGWVRIGAAGVRHSFDPATSSELNRLLGSSQMWAEMPITSADCTDPSGIIMLARHQGREFVSTYPCGFTGLTGQLASIVLAGRITDWTSVPPHLRPAGLPLSRFDEATQSHFRFQSGLYEERLITIRNEAAWEGQWRRMTAPKGAVPPLPPVEFRREMLLLAAMGTRGSGGYNVTIERVLSEGDEVLAFVRFVSPDARCGSIAAVTSPVDIVRLPRSEKNVRWVVERTEANCP